MTIRVVGAGLPRTGTTSLYTALPRLLGAPCYHMRELTEHLDHATGWNAGLRGDELDWDTFLAGYAAGVDWPFSACWRELAAWYPDAIVLLSRRESPEQWYESMSRTVLVGARRRQREQDDFVPPWFASATPEQRTAMDEMWPLMAHDVVADPDDRDAVMAAYERHDATVRAEVPAGRLVVWEPGDGWAPLCEALDVPVPDEPFPHENTTAAMQTRMREAGLATD